MALAGKGLTMGDLYTRGASYTCPRCGHTSVGSDDALNGYCGDCHDFTYGEPVRYLRLRGWGLPAGTYPPGTVLTVFDTHTYDGVAFVFPAPFDPDEEPDAVERAYRQMWYHLHHTPRDLFTPVVSYTDLLDGGSG